MDEPNAPQRPNGNSRPPSARAAAGSSAPPPSRQTQRERFALGLLAPTLGACLLANLLGGLVAPGVLGTLGDPLVTRVSRAGSFAALSAAVLSLGTLVLLISAVVQNGRTNVSTRLVSTFGAGLVFTLVTTAVRNEPLPPLLIVLLAAAFAVAVAGAVEALSRPETRALGLQLALLSFATLLRLSAWGASWLSQNRQIAGAAAWSTRLMGGSVAFEFAAFVLVLVYLAYRPGLRGLLLGALGVVVAFVLATWALGGSTSTSAGRAVLQHAIAMRVQWGGPLPFWVDPQASVYEIGMLGRSVRTALLPLAVLELGSVTVGVLTLGAASRASLAMFAAMGLALASRGQADQPLRALELAVAGLGALALARSTDLGKRE